MSPAPVFLADLVCYLRHCRSCFSWFSCDLPKQNGHQTYLVDGPNTVQTNTGFVNWSPHAYLSISPACSKMFLKTNLNECLAQPHKSKCSTGKTSVYRTRESSESISDLFLSVYKGIKKYLMNKYQQMVINLNDL